MRVKKSDGFTIVELLVVIIVIGVLAAIMSVSYVGIQDRARVASVQSDLAQAVGKLESYKSVTSLDNKYPINLSDAGVKTSNGTTINYSYPSNGKDYCISAVSGSTVLSATSVNPKPQAIDCIDNGLVGWWKLNGNANDSSGNNKNGTVFGATLATGQNGQANSAYSFNGTASDYINISNFDYGVMMPTSFNSNWTMSIWAYWGGTSSNERILIGRNGCNGGIYMYGGQYTFAIKGAGCWTGAQSIPGLTIDYSWHLLTATYEAGFMTFYDNGALQGTATLLDMNNYSTMFGIGSGGASNWTFSGTLDDARVYNRALSLSEVQSLFSAGAQ